MAKNVLTTLKNCCRNLAWLPFTCYLVIAQNMLGTKVTESNPIDYEYLERSI